MSQHDLRGFLARLGKLGRLLAALKEPRWPGGLRDALAWWPKFAQLARMAPQRVMMGVWSYLRQVTYIKFVVVVDEDIDARDWRQVIWASKRK